MADEKKYNILKRLRNILHGADRASLMLDGETMETYQKRFEQIAEEAKAVEGQLEKIEAATKRNGSQDDIRFLLRQEI